MPAPGDPTTSPPSLTTHRHRSRGERRGTAGRRVLDAIAGQRRWPGVGGSPGVGRQSATRTRTRRGRSRARHGRGPARQGNGPSSSGWSLGRSRPRLTRTVADDSRPDLRAPRAVNVAPQHRPRQPGLRHARPRARRGPRSVGAWVGVLALAGFALSPEQAAPAAELTGHPPAARARRPHRVDDRRRGARPPARPRRGHRPPSPLVGARWGTDIGWPQCGHALPDIDVDFTIVQVTAGRPGTVSPCLTGAGGLGQVGAQRGERVRGARLALGRRPGRGRPRAGPAAVSARAGCGQPVPPMPRTRWPVPRRPAWTREGGGSTSRTSPRAPCGAPTPTPTRRSLIGWRDELRRAGKKVGVYSTRGYWRQVVGHWQADLPQWPAVGLAGVDAARRACARPFTSGPVLITQWLTGPLDGNLLCPGRDRLAAAFFGHFARARTAGVPALLITPVPHPDIEAALRAQAALEAAQAERDQAGRGRGRGRGEASQGRGQGPASPAAPTRPPSTPDAARADRTRAEALARAGRARTPTDAGSPRPRARRRSPPRRPVPSRRPVESREHAARATARTACPLLSTARQRSATCT